ncbi:HEAT repeat domain-containing protein (plasmid) [Phormidium sp. CLA17]|uniref:HEAT repeat domain-containing protein n=1 Tax=Leptolyngbya sp. Cla-17 TaxID=2803751 RepID=UPI001492EDF3|nr:HEAT repeat domain-containing protein [Leptolyngbya sp. Cla-17]MBM0745529.1 HEAT repeat domain-containing protein [Leptolyngbya sp. Cla-17]
MLAPAEFHSYLQEICCRYEQWWTENALTETIAVRQATFSFEQMVQTEEKDSEGKSKKITLPIFKAVQKYIQSDQSYTETEHILLVGSPGVGKSTALLRCLFLIAEKEREKPEPRLPVLVPMKKYKVSFSNSEDPSGMLTLIRGALPPKIRRKVSVSEVEELLFDKRLILLLDGLNEMPADTIRTHLKAFREECQNSQVSLICTTRELGGGDLGIKRRLEIQPLRSEEVERFLQDCIPDQKQKVLQLLNRDNRELSRTPFVLWMLYDLFQKQGIEVETLAESFRQFFQSFKKYKEDAPVSDERRQEWNLWLEHLAFTMLNNPDPTDPGLVISKEQAEKSLIEKFGSLYGASSRIGELLDHYLLEPISEKEISFQHQLIQEYYAAECLLAQLPGLLKKPPEQKYTPFQMDYLNYVKWTEAISLMFGLLELEKEAEKLVEMTLGVDLKLSARLAGEVKPNLQTNTVKIIADQEVPEWFRIFLLGETKSPKAIDVLMNIIQQSDSSIRRRVVWASRQLDIKFAMPLFKEAIKDPDPSVRETTIRAVAESDIEQAVLLATQILSKESAPSVREAAVICALGKSETEAAILALLQATQDKENDVRAMAAHNLEKMNCKILLSILSKTLKNKIIAPDIRKSAAKQLGKLGDESITCDLFEAQLDLNSNISKEAACALQEVRSKLSQQGSDLEIHQEEQNKRQIDSWHVYLRSEEPIPRGNAIYHLTSLLDKEVAIELALQALDDTHPYVRGHAITKLVKLVGAEAIPQAVKALDDMHYGVRDKASQALIDMKKDSLGNLEIFEETVSNLIQILGEDKNVHVQSTTINTLTNLCSIHPSLLSRQDLENAILNASHSSDNYLRQKAAKALGQFSSEISTRRLLQLMGDSVSHTVLTSTEAIKNISYQITAKFLPKLAELIFKSEEGFVLDAIAAIQSRCGFYNYDIAQAKSHQSVKGRSEENLLHDKLDTLTQEVKKVSEEPKRVIHTQSYFEKGTHTHAHNYANDETLKQEITDLRQLVSQLQQKHQPTTEAAAIQVFDVELHTLQRTNPNRWETIQKQLQLLKHQLFNPERHLTASKAAIAEVAKHYLEDSVLAKALITYVDTMSADTDQGK